MSTESAAPIQPLLSDDVPSPQKQSEDATTPQPRRPHRRKKSSGSLPDSTTLPLIVVALICIVSCIATVWYANGELVAEWIPSHRPAVQPTVLLALFAAVFGFCTKTVFASGVAIVWWRTLEREDARLADLHYVYKRGIGESIGDTWKALRSSQARLILAVLVIVTAVDLSDGPLLQRSIKTDLSTHVSQYRANLDVATNIPDGWSGTIDSTGGPAALYRSGALGLMQRRWWTNQTVKAKFDCGGRCSGAHFSSRNRRELLFFRIRS